MTGAAIECRGLTKRFPGRLAVSDLDLEVPRGAAFALLGPNGAGKTTTIQMVLGLIRPSSGTSRVLGGSIRSTAIRQRIGFVPEKFQLPTYLTCREFLTKHAELARIAAPHRHAQVRRVLELTTLTERADDRLRSFSKGMQQRAMIAQALLGDPELLILDEPTSALDPHGRRDVRRIIMTVVEGGTTVVLNSHILSEVEAVCTNAAIIQSGRVVRAGPIAGFGADRLVVRIAADRLDDSALGALRAELGANAGMEMQPDGRIVLSGHVASDEELPHLAGIVQEAGGRLFELTCESETLEDVFMRLTRPSAGDVSP